MRKHTQSLKENIKIRGRELDSILSYTLNGERIELGKEELNSVTPVAQSNILKSAMKELDIDSNIDIPIGTIVNYKLGVSLNDSPYEYLDYGNYIVYSSEKQEDTNSYNIICYDKMLYSMIDYVPVDIEYPCTVRDYINAVCEHLNLEFASKTDEFANWDRVIESERYLDSEGNSLGYTFRDVLDELSQVTASTICLNNDDKVEIRYINDTNDTIDGEYLKDVNVKFGEKYGPINSIVLSRAAESDNVYLQDEDSIEQNGLCELKISDNQIMALNDRSDYLPDILEKLNGLEYYINDFSSTGICYYEICDRYNVNVDDQTYSCIMFNDQQNITQGLEELVYTDMPNESETDYKKADKTDRRINQAYIIVDKHNLTIEQLVSQTDSIRDSLESDYVTNNQLENRITQTTRETTNMISQTGGFNLLLNSQFYQNATEWEKSEPINFETLYGTLDIEQNTSCKSELKLNNGSLKQSYVTTVGKEYTVSFKYKKQGTPSKESSVKLFNGVNYINVLIADNQVNNRTQVSYTYTATVKNPQIIIETNDDSFYISDLIIQPGNSTEWSQNANETRGLGHTLTGSNLTIYDVGTSGEKIEIDPNSIEYYDGNTLKSYYSKTEMKTDKAEIVEEANVCGLNFRKINDNEIILS